MIVRHFALLYWVVVPNELVVSNKTGGISYFNIYIEKESEAMVIRKAQIFSSFTFVS
jgi:hypothetical protein